MQLEPGMRVHQYELIRELGRGGMGIVYVARDTKLGRQVAIKFLRNATREIADRFLVEARATAQCNHDNIVIIHEVEEYEGIPYMVLEFLEGQSLRGLMGSWDAGHRLAPSRVVELILPMARALARAHQLGIVHRDLKPENVIVTDAGQVKVLDFGIAKALGEPNQSGEASLVTAERLQLTDEGSMLGTLPYMAPEQMGVGGVDHRSDLWAVGIIMFEMLAGRHPIESTSEALFANLANDEPMASVRDSVPEISAELADIVDRCLAKAKHERMATAAELVRRLDALRPQRPSQESLPLVVHSIDPTPRPKPRRRWPVAVALALVGGLALAIVIRDRGRVDEPRNEPIDTTAKPNNSASNSANHTAPSSKPSAVATPSTETAPPAVSAVVAPGSAAVVDTKPARAKPHKPRAGRGSGSATIPNTTTNTGSAARPESGTAAKPCDPLTDFDGCRHR